METLLRHLLSEDPNVAEVPDLSAFFHQHESVRARFDVPFDAAVAGGFGADRIGYAFAAGYVSALEHMVPSLAGVPAGLCVTEAKGNRPNDMETTLSREGDAFRLSGEKTFVTFGAQAEELLVIARQGELSGRANLVAVRIPSHRVGVSLVERDPTPFAPEIPHAKALFASVRVAADEVLEGDAYVNLVKPFRTVEDIHVHAAILALLLRFGRQAAWAHGVLERLLSTLVALRAISVLPALSPATHLALAGVLDTTGRFLDAELPALAQDLPVPDRDRLFRDAALFGIAAQARAKRRVTAWAALTPQ